MVSTHLSRFTAREGVTSMEPPADTNGICKICGTEIDDPDRAFWTDRSETIVQGAIMRDTVYVGFTDGPYCGLACVVDADPLGTARPGG